MHNECIEVHVTAVVCIHSGGFTSRQWKRLGERLAPHFRVIAPDLLGYAERWPDGEPFDYRQDVERIAAMLDEPMHVVGHSYGGLVALQVALARPDRVRSLAVYEPVAFGVLDAAARADIEQLPAYRLDAPDVWLEAFVDWWNGAGAWRALAESTQQAMRVVGWKVSEEVRSLVADRTDLARYATIAAPTLLLGGERTRPVERSVLEALARALPHATLEVFPGMGHMGPITHADRVNAAIEAHLLDAEKMVASPR
jgi:pimeloyl-ACP methyl ester carboxylesterase